MIEQVRAKLDDVGNKLAYTTQIYTDTQAPVQTVRSKFEGGETR